ncbi:MAG: T9SS type A sorting domain-containing protein [Lewinellaceae bacterium]|nr:T9SS type A sorting domain-containing protein [Lewinellaceae bacterium]
MKHSSLLLFLCLSISLFGQLPYTPFEFAGSIWREVYYDGSSGGGSQGVYTEDYQYTVDGDTVINSISYFKLNVLGFAQYGSGPMSPKFYFGGYRGAIRETANKEIRIIFPADTVETFLYSFDIHPGDTVQTYYSSGNIITVEQIDTVEICGKPRNRYLLHFSNGILTPVYLIEGVGNTHGLIPRYEFFENGARLNCYSNSDCTPCEMIVGQKEPALELRVEIFPNPAWDKIAIRSVKMADALIEVFDNQGKSITRTRLTGGIEMLDVSNWATGVYYVKIRWNDTVQVEKMVKN